jgi:uncharacterized protein with PQ loop repeat
MFTVLIIEILLCLAYGIIIRGIPLVVANAVTLVFGGMILKHG